MESYGHTTIPNRGAWFELDTDAKGIGYVRIDRTRKLPFTTIMRALGFGSDEAIFEILGDSELTRATIEKTFINMPATHGQKKPLKTSMTAFVLVNPNC